MPKCWPIETQGCITSKDWKDSATGMASLGPAAKANRDAIPPAMDERDTPLRAAVVCPVRYMTHAIRPGIPEELLEEQAHQAHTQAVPGAAPSTGTDMARSNRRYASMSTRTYQYRWNRNSTKENTVEPSTNTCDPNASPRPTVASA